MERLARLITIIILLKRKMEPCLHTSIKAQLFAQLKTGAIYRV